MIDLINTLADDALDAESAILLTYELDLPVYDGWVRRRLASAGVVNQVVFCDLSVYNRELESLSAARRCGRRYSVVPIPQPASFHPKVYVLLGRRHGRRIVSSGNLTLGGMLRNAEVAGVFDYDRGRMAGPHPAFRAVVDWASDMAASAPSVVRKQLSRARAIANWLELSPLPDGREILIGGPGRSPLLDQARAILGRTVPVRATVLSSSFDRRLTALERLVKLTRSGLVRCVVKPNDVHIDGKAARRLRGAVTWHPFVDPFPREKRRKDVRAHAKLIILECDDRELVLYGSANASRPALLDEDGNSEVIVAFWAPKPGATVEQLRLEKCFDRPRIDDVIAQKDWPEEAVEAADSVYPYVLTGATVHDAEARVYTTADALPAGTAIEVSQAVGDAALTSGALRRLSHGEYSLRGRVPDHARVCRLITTSGNPISNYAVLTSPDLAEPPHGSGLAGRTRDALAAMQDGYVLGTVLFELLDQYRDFEIVMGRPRAAERHERGGRDGRQSAKGEGGERPASAYYTDATAAEFQATSRVGDRADLDLLAALVQPLNVGGNRSRASDVEDEEDDSAIEEEAERRAIDRKQGAATGDEKPAPAFGSPEALERAARRLVKRLQRSAMAIEQALDRRDALPSVPSAALARQIWMMHIAAFLAGRRLPTDNGDWLRALEPGMFSDYVLRICRAMAGGKSGGMLTLVTKSDWETTDGETLKLGLAFLWTCCVWAVMYTETRPIDEPGAMTAAQARLIAARFIAFVRSLCDKPDMHDLERRLPACEDVAVVRRTNRSCTQLADTITRYEEGKQRPRSPQPVPLKPGDLVFHPMIGVTLLVATEPPDNCMLLDLSQTSNAVRVFVEDRVVRVSSD
jgi:hypothetical protein